MNHRLIQADVLLHCSTIICHLSQEILLKILLHLGELLLQNEKKDSAFQIVPKTKTFLSPSKLDSPSCTRVISGNLADDFKKKGEKLDKRIQNQSTLDRRSTETLPADLKLDLPGDLIENILHRLPVNSLVRFQITCRGWKTLFSERRFIYAHLKISQNNQSFLHSRDSSQIWMLDDLVTSQSPRYFLLHDFKGEHIRALSACDGLIIFYTFSRNLAIWNCNLGVTAWIAREYLSTYDWYSLGRNRNMLYKVLRFTICGRLDRLDEDCDYYGPEAEIYDLDSHIWKSVDMEETWGLYRQKFVVVSVQGNSYWLAEWFSKDLVFRQSFDFSTDMFMPIQLPIRVKTSDKTTAALSCFKADRVCLLYQEHQQSTEIWVTNRVGDQSVSAWWKILVVTSQHPVIHPSPSYFINQETITIFCEEVSDDAAQIKLLKIAQAGVEQKEIETYSPAKSCVPSKSCVYVQSLIHCVSFTSIRYCISLGFVRTSRSKLYIAGSLCHWISLASLFFD